MALKAFVFDVGETLVDETGMWERAADAAGVPRFTLMGVLGGLAARGEHHDRAWGLLGVEHPASTWDAADFYPDALPCLDDLRSRGFLVGAVGNTPAETEDLLREHVDLVGSSARWGIEKPAAGFFERIVARAASPPTRSPTSATASTTMSGRDRGRRGPVHIRRGPGATCTTRRPRRSGSGRSPNSPERRWPTSGRPRRRRARARKGRALVLGGVTSPSARARRATRTAT